MDLLARREHARAELERKLGQRGFPSELIASELDRLAAEGLQDDARYLEAFVHSRIVREQGPMKIRAALSQLGLDGGEVDLALEAVGVDWVALAREARERKFGSELPQDYPTQARQMRFLSGRGFTAEQCRAAVGDED